MVIVTVTAMNLCLENFINVDCILSVYETHTSVLGRI